MRPYRRNQWIPDQCPAEGPAHGMRCSDYRESQDGIMRRCRPNGLLRRVDRINAIEDSDERKTECLKAYYDWDGHTCSLPTSHPRCVASRRPVVEERPVCKCVAVHVPFPFEVRDPRCGNVPNHVAACRWWY